MLNEIRTKLEVMYEDLNNLDGHINELMGQLNLPLTGITNTVQPEENLSVVHDVTTLYGFVLTLDAHLQKIEALTRLIDNINWHLAGKEAVDPHLAAKDVEPKEAAPRTIEGYGSTVKR